MLSLHHLTELLASYVPSDGTFLTRLNQALARLCNLGTYRDMTVQYSLPVVGGTIYLPKDADAILHCLINGVPSHVRSQWHDLKTIGTAGNSLDWGLVDAGFSPVFMDLTAATDTLYLVPSAESFSRTTFGDSPDEELEILANDGSSRYRFSSSNGGFNGTTIVFEEPITYIDSIRFDSLSDSFDIRTVSGDPATTVATVGPDTGVTRYRRFRTPNTEDGSAVQVLCKRAFCPLLRDSDISPINNINAIKYGLLAVIAEDSYDVDRSDQMWARAVQLLEEEMSSIRGAAKPRATLDPHGTEGRWGIQAMM